jgi:hypothetical protein
MAKGIKTLGFPRGGARVYARKGRYPELRLPKTVTRAEFAAMLGDTRGYTGRYLDIDHVPHHLELAIEKGFWKPGPLTRNKKKVYNNNIQKYFGELFLGRKGLSAWVKSVMNKTGDITAEAIAAEALARVYAASNYNNYTGNLSGAFYAAIVRGRKVVGKFEINEEEGGFKSGQYTTNDNGRKIAYLQEPPRHTHSIKKIGKANRYRKGKSARRYRYIKKWERLEGYKGMTILQKRGGAFGYMTEQGKGTTQSGIIIGNTAPYSNKLGKKYTVLKGAKVRGEVNGKWNKETRNIYRSIGKADIDYLYKLFGARNVKW